jgi:iron complex outermembrane recepter protein
MKKIDPARIALLLASVAATPFAIALPAAAQDAPIAGEEEIVVTARRTEESLQDVPASVSAFNGAALERLGATEATGLQGAVPNLNVVQGRGSSNATNVYIRGVGQPDALQTFDPAVGFYVDGVYYSRIRGTQMELFDLERVEVLRGPQGTLYGKNTIGGAISVITRRPGDEPHTNASLTIGEYNQGEVRVSASTPITDNFAIGGAFFAATRDGYVTNPTTGEEYNDRNVWGARFQTAWDPTSQFSVDFAVDYTEEDNALTMGQATNSLTNVIGASVYPVPTPTPEFTFHAEATPGLPNSSVMDHGGASLRLGYDLGNGWTIKSITGYRELSYADYVDIDATTVELGDVFVAVDQDQISQELQAIYEGDRLTVVSGLYYLQENITSHQEAYADAFVAGFLGLTSFTRTVDDDLETTSTAAYVNASYDLTERLSISGGVRYTEEEKDYFRTTSQFYSNPAFNGLPFFFDANQTWDDTSGMVSLDYRLSDNVLLYGRVAQGFKSGGFNGRANDPGTEQPYDPETVLSYELGAKTDWMDGRVRANLAIFHNDYEDFQARVSRVVTSPSQPVPGPDFAVLNAGALDINGAELELTYLPIENLRLDAQIGYLNAEYGEFFEERLVQVDPLPAPQTLVTIDRSFQEPAFSPEWTARFGANYEFNLGDHGSLALNGSARFRSEHALAVDNSDVFTEARFPGMWQDDYWLYDASITWRDPSEHFSAAVVGRNLSDEVYRTDAQEFSSVGGIRTAYYGAPSTVSLVLTARY